MSKTIKTILILIVVIIAIVLLNVVYMHSVQNKAFQLEEQIAGAKADIDVQQKRRGDLIPNLVDCVKAYDKHEYETLLALIQARGTASDATVGEVQTIISAVAEAYPELQSSANYRELMNELAVTENLIANYRESYNKQVRAYRFYIRSFPHVFFLQLTGYEAKQYSYLEFNASEDAPTGLF